MAGVITWVKLDPKLNEGIKELYPLVMVSLVVTIFIECALICCSHLARKVPTNYILLSIFTLFEAFIFAFICAFYTAESCIEAAGMTAGVTVALTLYAMFTKTDFTVCGQLMSILCAVSFMLIIAGLFMSVNNWGNTLIAAVFVIIYGIYLIIDTQLVLGNHSYGLSTDDYIVGALLIYLDIMMLFLKLLEIFG